MTMAMRRLKSIGWAALVFFVLILLYPLSLKVATVRSDLSRVEREILSSRKEISFLEAEMRTRASPEQLEDWNKLLYGYTAPTARQYVDGERALAELDGPIQERTPVLVSAADTLGGVMPAGTTHDDASSAAATEADAAAPEAPESRAARHDRQLAAMERELISDTALREIQRQASRETTDR